LKGGSLAYNVSSFGKAVYNTMSTPKGRQFQVTLPDGTKVWLNAASSLRYPTVFTGAERKVTVTGEAYFEVAHNERMPFVVNVNDKEEVTVLGTHFNVNAYDNEKAIHTTLLQGSVKVVNRQPAVGNQQLAILKPGQQAI
jgi:ferric-dicitrate binding protein FerR (iron transport regulator)